MFALLDQFPLAEINAVIVMVLIVLWFVSGADAASIVMGILLSRLGEPAAAAHRVLGHRLGGGRRGAAAAGRGLTALEQAMVVMSAPFMIVMVILTVGLLKALRGAAEAGRPTPVVPAPARQSRTLQVHRYRRSPQPASGHPTSDSYVNLKGRAPAPSGRAAPGSGGR